MTNSLQKLKFLWSEEKDHYRKVEVGTGVQSFVKKILESPDIFSLKEGKLSTKLENRKNEFIHEKKAKERRKADFYIFINPEIAIPVEAECFGNIQIGEPQLFKYQKDFEKQYGILTDGFTWRFYNNNVFKIYTLDDILDKTQLFLTFWREYIKPEFYYLAFFERIGQLALTEEKILYVEDYRQSFFEDITKLIQSFKNKLQIEGYLEEIADKTKEQRAVELTYAYIIQFILYKTLVDNDFDEFPEEFEGFVNRIHEYLKQKRYKDILGIINGISAGISKNIYRPFAQEQEFIHEKIESLFHSAENKLNDVAPWLDIFVFIKKYNFANVRNEIFGYIYENYLKELYSEGQKGQYFTDPAVVNFMLEQVGFTPEKIKKRYEFDSESISLIDPACGSGTFLYSATDLIVRAFRDGYTEEASRKIEEIVSNNIFGLDIEEFPLYLAEMSILMRLLPIIIHQKYNNPIDKKIKVFKTRDSISEFMDTALRNTFADQTIEFQKKAGSPNQIPLFTQKLDLGYKSYVRDESDLEEMKKSLENLLQCPRRRFDYVIGNPPYVSYNQCTKQGVLIFKLMKEGKAKLNDIYGANLHSTPDNPKRYRPNPNLYAFFIALGFALLKDDGRLCYIIPQTVLVNADLDVVRYHLAKFVTIEKIITFSGKMFLGRGLKQSKPVATSSLIFVVSREQPKSLHEVELINYLGSDKDIEQIFKNISRGKKTKRKKILQNRLLQNIPNWNFIKLDRDFLSFYEVYRRNSEDISVYYSHVFAQQRFGSNFIFDGGYSIDERKLLPQPAPGEFNYVCPKLNNNFWTIQDICGFWPNIREKGNTMFIRLRQGSQGYRFLDSKHKIVWSYNNTDRFFYTDKPLIWARNKILGVGSDDKSEILYLFALLNSKITRFLLTNFIKIEHEDTRTILVSLQIIKNQIRVPRISDDNRIVKQKAIKLVEELVELDKQQLSDLVDFSRVLRQKFDSIEVSGNSLVLKKGKEEIRLPIKQNKELVQKVMVGSSKQPLLGLEEGEISLAELKSMPIIDYEKQEQKKDHIDDLVFALYFNLDIPKNKLNKPAEIKKLCQKNKFYKTTQNEN